ncbi:hypothetical protein Ciccas_000660 [Cichlidogyrus casuarinus]|uniref:LIM zinc-binding domain-containing protein n=1 Tax=Cichlidogyrus casuarinus TaxID=1844966 RepID=A0ABD2QM91_9PLAT
MKGKCWISKGRIMCEECHEQYFKCFLCKLSLKHTDQVHKLCGTFNCHASCLRCEICGDALSSKKAIALSANSIQVQCLDHEKDSEADLVETSYSCSSESFNDPDDEDRVSVISEDCVSLTDATKGNSSVFMRSRTIFNQEQIACLRLYYHQCPKPSSLQLEVFSKRLCLPKRTVRVSLY